VVVPAKALNELARVSGEEEAQIGVYINAARSQILFHLQGDAGANQGRIFGIDLVSQLLEGNFVNYRQIVPQNTNTSTVVDTEQLLRACRTSSIFVRNEANVIHVEIEPGADAVGDGGGIMRLTATSTEMGDSSIDLDAEIEGEGLTIAFNVRFLMDVLSVMESAQVVLDTTSSTRPGLLRPVGSDEFMHVIMPMHMRS
jgi:DNA polymerase-3 subunit beta